MTVRASHPILRLEIVQPDGTRASEHRVYCRLRKASMDVGTCCACPRCDRITAGESPSVDCTLPLEPEDLEPDPDGLRTEVGAMLERGGIAIAEGVTVRDALRVMQGEHRASVPVVGADGAILGVMHEWPFVSQVRASNADDAVAATMSSVLAVHESMPVRSALHLLASAHAREATVVTTEGTPLGVFRDVDGLQWLVKAKTPAER